jgi:hypothetical protein
MRVYQGDRPVTMPKSMVRLQPTKHILPLSLDRECAKVKQLLLSSMGFSAR